MDLIDFEDQKNAWHDRCQAIIKDDELTGKTKYYNFINAYINYLFFGGEDMLFQSVSEMENLANQRAIKIGLSPE